METPAEVFRQPETLDEHYVEIARLTHTIADEFLTDEHTVADCEWDHDGLTKIEFQFRSIDEDNPRFFAFITIQHLTLKQLAKYRISLNDTPRLDIHDDDNAYTNTFKLGGEEALEHASYVMNLLRSGVMRADRDDMEERFGHIAQDYAIDQVPRSVEYLARFQNQLIIEQYADNIVDPQSTSKPESSQRWRLNKDALRTRLDTRIAEQIARLSKIQRAMGAASVFLTSGMLENDESKDNE